MRQQHATQYPDLEQQSLIFNKYWIQTKRAKVEQGGGGFTKKVLHLTFCVQVIKKKDK